MLRIRTLAAVALAAGTFATTAPAASAVTWCSPNTPAYYGCWTVTGTCVQSSGRIVNKPYRLICPQ